uniref:Uncharacterized protein n=1 Tax=Daphnia galeata TaxID=27404 RepID=A0A8J2WQQ6_9CRUS|nr:unnamed protein product [Daphnia galeata]
MKSTSLSGNSSAGKAGGDDWGSAADAWSSVNTSSSNPWDKCPSASNSEQGQLLLYTSRNRPNVVGKTDEDDWGRSAEVTDPHLLPLDDRNVTSFEKRNDNNFTTSYRELNQSIVNAIAWNGLIYHGHRSFKTSMKNVDVNPPPVSADFEMPKSMRVMGTIEPKKVLVFLNFLQRPQLSWMDFYVIPLGKDSVVPLELTSLVKKNKMESELSNKIQEANSSEPSQVASAHPPTRMAAIRQKLQQDILSVDPVKA